jgi:hypothetical protein
MALHNTNIFKSCNSPIAHMLRPRPNISAFLPIPGLANKALIKLQHMPRSNGIAETWKYARRVRCREERGNVLDGVDYVVNSWCYASWAPEITDLCAETLYVRSRWRGYFLESSLTVGIEVVFNARG